MHYNICNSRECRPVARTSRARKRRDHSRIELRNFIQEIYETNNDLGGVPSSDTSNSLSSISFPNPNIKSTGPQTRQRTSRESLSTSPQHRIYKSNAVARSDDNPTLRTALHIENREREQWSAAILKEYKQLLQDTLIPISSTEINSLPSYNTLHMTTKLVRKHDASDPSKIKFKARGCGDGSIFRNIWTDNYSPTVNSVTLSLIQNISFLKNLKEFVVDTDGAYLYQDYPTTKTPIIVTLEPLVIQTIGLNPNQKYRLQKYIYGLPDSGQAYYNAYSSLLANNLYIQSAMDPCMFYKKYDTKIIYICFHVDDTYVCTQEDYIFDELINCLSSSFELTISHSVESYIGIKHTYPGD